MPRTIPPYNINGPSGRVHGPPFVRNDNQVLSSLSTGLVAYWQAEDQSGTDLISGNTVDIIAGNATNGVGKIGNCWTPNVGGATLLRTANTINLNFVSSFTFICWLKCSIAPQAIDLFFAKASGTGGFQVKKSATPGLFLRIINSVGGTKDATELTLDVDSAWHRFIFILDNTNSRMRLIKDSGAAVDTALAGFVYAPPVDADDLHLADLNRSGATTVDIDELGMWNRVLTDAELLIIWNGGAGKSYPFN